MPKPELWTVQDASKHLKVDQGFIRRVLNGSGIPGVDLVGRQWLGTPEDWKRWDAGREKRRKHK